MLHRFSIWFVFFCFWICWIFFFVYFCLDLLSLWHVLQTCLQLKLWALSAAHMQRTYQICFTNIHMNLYLIFFLFLIHFAISFDVIFFSVNHALHEDCPVCLRLFLHWIIKCSVFNWIKSTAKACYVKGGVLCSSLQRIIKVSYDTFK